MSDEDDNIYRGDAEEDNPFRQPEDNTQGTVPQPERGFLPRQNSQLCMWSMICGIVGMVCCIPLSIVAIVLGHMGLAETKRNPYVNGRGFGIAGLVLGYAGCAFSILGIILSLAGEGFGSFARI